MKIIWTSLRYLVVMTLITGVVYPLFIFSAGQALFPTQSNGSLVQNGGVVIGSQLIGQNFSKLGYFWSRPSSVNYNPLPSGGSNLGPTSADLKGKFVERSEALNAANPDSGAAPQDLVYASGSGLDPHISVEAARYQILRITHARGFSPEYAKQLDRLIDQMTENRTLGILGERRVNVLALNMALDSLDQK